MFPTKIDDPFHDRGTAEESKSPNNPEFMVNCLLDTRVLLACPIVFKGPTSGELCEPGGAAIFLRHADAWQTRGEKMQVEDNLAFNMSHLGHDLGIVMMNVERLSCRT